jgi:hypothetical protein
MSVFMGGGPITEPIRTVYRHIRRSLPADADIMETVGEIASGSAHHVPPTGDSRPTTGNESTHLHKIQKQAEDLRIAFNRLYFIKSNLMKFGGDELKKAEKDFEDAKKFLDFKESSLLNNIIRQVERYLENRRYFLTCK